MITFMKPDGSKQAYIFRGPPSSGKGTIIPQFLQLLPAKTAMLELDMFRWNFHLTNRNVADVTEEEHVSSYQNFLLILESYCKQGIYDIVAEGIFSWDIPSPHGNMQDILQILDRYGFHQHLFLLSGNRDVLWERNTKREYVVPREEFDMLYDLVMSKSGPEEIKIDVSKMTIEEAIGFLKENVR